MTRPRDSQRSKLYASEAFLSHGKPDFTTIPECQAFADSVMANRWVAARWKQRVECRPGFGHTRATGSYSGVIQLPLWARTRYVILHEMAHVLTSNQYAAHGPEYAGLLLGLVHHILGRETAAKLRESFKSKRVRYNLKAIPSSPRYEVPTQAAVAAKQRARDTTPLTFNERAQVAALLRRAAKAGQLGPADRKPRQHALATARLLEGASK